MATTSSALQAGVVPYHQLLRRGQIGSNLSHTAFTPFTAIQMKMTTRPFKVAETHRKKKNKKTSSVEVVRCSSSGNGVGIGDFIGGDLLKPDLGRWLSDVDEHKAIAIYTPHEGGYEGRYLNRLRYKGYHFLSISARGLGDPEATLTKIHPVCPVLSKSELQFLALLPDLRPNVRVIAECGNWRKFMWKPLKEIAGLTADEESSSRAVLNS